MISFLVFAFGLAVGSFLNSVIWRLERGESPLKGRSHCLLCNHSLSWQDLIPLVSFLFLRGKCRYCQRKISWQYPLVELATAILFVLIFSHLNLGIVSDFGFRASDFATLLYFWFIAGSLIAIFIYDLRHYIIPDRFVYSAILVSGIWYFVSSLFFDSYTRYEIQNTIYAAIGVASFFFLIYALSKGRAMGFGDVKLALLIGLFLGWPNILVALFFAFFLGALVGVFLVLSSKKKWKSQVPFGPFLITGTFLALFMGEQIVHWYLGLLLV